MNVQTLLHVTTVKTCLLCATQWHLCPWIINPDMWPLPPSLSVCLKPCFPAAWFQSDRFEGWTEGFVCAAAACITTDSSSAKPVFHDGQRAAESFSVTEARLSKLPAVTQKNCRFLPQSSPRVTSKNSCCFKEHSRLRRESNISSTDAKIPRTHCHVSGQDFHNKFARVAMFCGCFIC